MILGGKHLGTEELVHAGVDGSVQPGSVCLDSNRSLVDHNAIGACAGSRLYTGRSNPVADRCPAPPDTQLRKILIGIKPDRTARWSRTPVSMTPWGVHSLRELQLDPLSIAG